VEKAEGPASSPIVPAEKTRRRYDAIIIGFGLTALLGVVTALTVGRLREQVLARNGAHHIQSLAVLPLENLWVANS
jgi:hypothetical protein